MRVSTTPRVDHLVWELPRTKPMSGVTPSPSMKDRGGPLFFAAWRVEHVKHTCQLSGLRHDLADRSRAQGPNSLPQLPEDLPCHGHASGSYRLDPGRETCAMAVARPGRNPGALGCGRSERRPG